ncbi:hypothetical protein LIER_03377 [Lithospermum erythrorhizon]|uniref:Uncharacterized protein n=1 Tax=Lithospermum erythrorhizon TaxID=34254 RepID=A0AAV3NTN2_LITER
MGAEFTIGDLKFSKDHDPFANIAIPQDVAREVASRLNDKDTGGKPLDADVISAEPLSICHPSNPATNSSHSHTTPSSSQTARPAQANTNTDKLDEVLATAAKCVEPKEELEAPVEKVAQPAVAVSKKSSTIFEKRPAPAGEHPRLFSTKRLKSIADNLPRSEILDLTEDPRFSTISCQEAPKEGYSLNSSTSELLPEEEADFAPKMKLDAFRASRPFLLERIRKDYDSIGDPLEVHGTVARHLIKALNVSYALACRADLQDDARAEACEKEKALQLQIHELNEDNERLKAVTTLEVNEKKEAAAQTLAEIKKHDLLQSRFTRLEGENFDISNKLQLVHDQSAKKMSVLEQRAKTAEETLSQLVEKAIYDYQRSEAFHSESGKEAACFLCRFTKTYKEVNPSIVENYEEFIQGYDPDWFAPLHLSAPLTSSPEEDEEDDAPSTSVDAPAS